MTWDISRLAEPARALATFAGANELVGLLSKGVVEQSHLNRLVSDHLLRDPRRPPPADLMGAGRLLPRYQAVPFLLREAEERDFLDWCCDSSKKLAIRLVTGGSGRGKTRLMIELVGKLRDGALVAPGLTRSNWVAGFLATDLLERLDGMHPRYEVPFGARGDLFIVLDYAENKRREVTALLKAALAAHDAGRGDRVRIVLIARHNAEVFQDLMRQESEFAGRGLIQMHVDPLAPVPEPQSFYAAACEAFGVADDARAYPDKINADFGLLSIAAMLAATTGDAPPSNQTAILEDALSHEGRYWIAAARAKGLPEALDEAVLEGIAAVTLFGLQGAIPDITAAAELLAALPRLADQDMNTRLKIAQIAAELYPHPAGHVEGVALDLLGDQAATSILTARLEAVKGLCSEHVKDAQLISAFTRAGWMAARDADTVRPLLGALCDRFGERGLRAIVDVAPNVGHQLGDLAADWALASKEFAVSADLVFGLPEHTVALRKLAAVLTQKALEASSGATTEMRAGLKNNLAYRLSDLGQREAALEATHEAVALYRDLAEAQPEAFTPNLAGSLNNLANGLSNLGQREAALEAAQEAVAIRRGLAEARPEAFTPDLAMSLNNLANRLSYLGQREAALVAAKEAVALYRDLAEAQPEAFTPNLAGSLNNLANGLSNLGQREAAQETAQEAVALYRNLAEARPEAFTPDLAMSLNNLANFLSDLGQREAALEAAQEAV
ncbi:tetratricopeptide repeat protein, partial [Rhodovulum sulfidophilum]|uniref:tetratricopeptide repeat protein n=1 Tax=Rhodovulum sulfidophilum TaxID=35806 RepID=UPI001926C692